MTCDACNLCDQDILQQVLQILLKTKLLVSEGISETDIPPVLPDAAVISLFTAYKKYVVSEMSQVSLLLIHNRNAVR